MRITRRQLRRVVRESLDILQEDVWRISHEEIVQSLADRAKSYHRDRALDLDDDGIPDAPGIRALLQDDFMDDFGHQAHISDFEDLIDRLANDHNTPLDESNPTPHP